MDAAGDFVIAWDSDNQDGSTSASTRSAYSAAGVPLGADFASTPSPPTIRLSRRGGGRGRRLRHRLASSGQDAVGQGVLAQPKRRRRAVGGEFRVNTFTTGNQGGPAVAWTRRGNFVVAWRSINQAGARAPNDIYAQR